MVKVVNFCAGASMNFRPSMKVDGVLVNAINHGSTNHVADKCSDFLTDVGAVHTITDSGGFQIAGLLDQYDVCRKNNDNQTVDKLKKKIEKILQVNTPEVVCKIANKFSSDIVMALDMPISNFSDDQLQANEFQKKVGVNLMWANDSIKFHRKYCPESKLILPLQCYNVDQIDKFLAGISSDDFDGVSIPTRNHNIADIVKMITYIYSTGIKQIHILGSSKILVIAALSYLARHHLEWASFDSTSWSTAALNLRYIDPRNLKQLYLKKVNVENSRCSCPWCRKYKFLETARSDYDFIYHLANHNYWVVDNAVRTFNNISKNLNDIENYLKKVLKKKDHKDVDCLIHALREFDFLAGSGFESLLVKNIL